MKRKIIIAAPQGKIRDLLIELFRGHFETIALKRENIIKEGALYLENQTAFWGDVDLLTAHAAIILDSGFMWPMPQLLPTESEWEIYRENFDDYLRAERESNSLWLSLLDILNVEIELCFNPQTAFAHEALKPAAFELLASRSISVAPFVASNDPSVVKQFAESHASPLRAVSLVPGDSPSRVGWDELNRWDFEKVPIMLQACEEDALAELVVAGGEVYATDSGQGISTELKNDAITCAKHLDIGLGNLTFQISAEQNTLVDFSARPSLDEMDDGECRDVLTSLCEAIKKSEGGSV